MTVETAVSGGHRLVFVLNPRGFFGNLPVTIKTKLVAGLFQGVGKFGTVRFMALDAIALHGDFVNAVRTFRDDIGMTPAAKPCRCGCQQGRMIRSVGLMAAGAFPGFDQGVQVRAAQFLLNLGVALQTLLAGGTGLESEILLKRGGDNRRCNKG
jgi:hypothetical protein